MSRRKLPRAIEKPDYTPLWAECGSCVYNALQGCQPVKPRIVPNSRFLVVLDQPDPVSVKHGELRTTVSQKLLERGMAESGADDVSYLYATACRRPKEASDKDEQQAIESCRPRLATEIKSVRQSSHPDVPVRNWLLALGEIAFKATTGKLGSSDAWRGSPVQTESLGKVIPSWDPYVIGTAKGSRYAAVWATHLYRYVQLATGQLGDFIWPESVVDGWGPLGGSLSRLAEHAEAGGEVSVDIETHGLGLDAAISCIGFACGADACCIQLPLSGDYDVLVRRILSAGVMVGQNISAFDRRVLSRAGYELTPHYEDTLLAASVLDPQLPKNLGALVSAEYHAPAHKAEFKSDKETGVLQGMWDSSDPAVERERRIYCLRDSYTTLLVWRRQKERLAAYGWDHYQKLKAADVIALRMRETGLEWDFIAGAELEAKYTEQRERIRGQLQKGATSLGLPNLNPGSTKQLAELFYGKMRVAPSVWTPEGKPSTNDDALLEIMKCDNPTAQEFARKVADYREADKALGTYIVGLRPVGQTRVYGMWRAHTAISGRWSCTEVPLQTLSSEMRRLIRATPGKQMCEADLPSAEVRTVMLFIGDDEMIALLNDGGDLYSTCATEMFSRPVNKKENPKLRQLGKLIILASNYGAAPETVWRQVIKQEMKDDDGVMKRVMEVFPQLNVKQVDVLQRGYFRKVPKLPLWQRQETADSGKRGYYFCPFSGRKIHFYGPPDLNLATNLPNQSTVAWYMDRALKAVWADLKPTDTLLTYVHDSLCVESLPEDIKATQAMLHKHMEGELCYNGRTIKMAPVESKIGTNLADVK